jgi:hypothetical protein
MYDLIGDIHGHAEELIAILEQLGYDCGLGYFAHRSRKAVFVGDLIDRGPQIRETLAVVRPMVEHGSAFAVMGNHEFNALCYHTPHPNEPDCFLRPHSAKNSHQHVQTIRQIPPAELREQLDWFRTLPLWLEIDGLRVVHACWESSQMEVIRQALEKHHGVTTEFLFEASKKASPLYAAIEDVLKGKEMRLPPGVAYQDKDGHERNTMRIKWYESPAGHSYESYALTVDAGLPNTLLSEELHSQIVPYPSSAPPVFFGHYWLQSERPTILAPNVACLDYSVAKGGMLVAYRWDGERVLSDHGFHCQTARR